MSLTPVVIVVVVLFVVLGVASRLVQYPASRSSGATTYPYYAKKALFSVAERSFLGVLEQAVEGRYRVFGKVRLADALGGQASRAGVAALDEPGQPSRVPNPSAVSGTGRPSTRA